MIDCLKASAGLEVLKSITSTFQQHDHNFEILSFYEQQPTKSPKLRLKSIGAKSLSLVSQDLTELSANHSRAVGLKLSHIQMMAFPSRTDTIFDQVITQLDTLRTKCEQAASTYAQIQVASQALQQLAAPSVASNTTLTDAIVLTPSSLGGGAASSSPIYSSQSLSLPPEGDQLSAKLPCHMLRPHQPNPYFVGRHEIIEKMKAILYPSLPASQKSFLLHGLGGMGKTQTALKFIFESKDTYRAILWAHAEDKTKLAEDFAEYAKELGLVKELGRDLEYSRKQLLSWYAKTTEPWLVVFDNLDLPDATQLRNVLKDFWPIGTAGAVLVTSRNREVMSTYTRDSEMLDILDELSSIQLLTKLIPSTRQEKREDLERVVHQVDYLPLGILSAASFIRNDGLSAGDFLETYGNSDMIQDSNAHNINHVESRYQHTLATVWDIEFRNLETKAKAFLFLLAFLDADKVQERLLSDGARKAAFPGLQFISNVKAFNVCRILVTRSYLVSRNPDTRQIWMHRLVKANCHVRMTSKERQDAFEAAVRLLVAELPSKENHDWWNIALRSSVREQLAHVASLNRYYLESTSDESTYVPLQIDAYFVQLLFRAGW